MYLPFQHEEECDEVFERFDISAQSIRFQNGSPFVMIHGFKFGAYVQGMFLLTDDILASIYLRTSRKGGNRLAGCEGLPSSSITLGAHLEVSGTVDSDACARKSMKLSSCW